MLQQELYKTLISDNLNSKIHIWSAILDQPEFLTQKYYCTLSSSERNQIDKNRFRLIRDRQIISRGLLRTLLATYLDCDYQEIIFEYNEYGKPSLSLQSKTDNICFNLSHSNNLVMFVFAKNKRVGIDVEQMQEMSDMAGVIDLCFSESEKNWFNNFSIVQKKEIFYKIWTGKESYIKAIGRGFSFPPNKISTNLNTAKELYFEEIIGDEDIEKWHMETFSPHPNFTSAFVVDDNDIEVEYSSINPCFIQEKNS